MTGTAEGAWKLTVQHLSKLSSSIVRGEPPFVDKCLAYTHTTLGTEVDSRKQSGLPFVLPFNLSHIR